MSQATSQVEKHFQRHNVYKRSKRYIDIQKMNEEEHSLQVYRRIPHSSIESMDTRVNSSFMNANEIAHERLQRDISQFKKRLLEEETVYQTNAFTEREKSPKKDKIKAPDLHKMTARKQFGGPRPTYKNEDRFNNFSISSPTNRSSSFKKNLPRANFVTINPDKTIDYDKVVKAKSKSIFNESVYKCLFDYTKTRKSYESPEIQPPKEIPQHRLRKAEKLTKVNPSPMIHSFYHTISKQTPSQMDLKVLKNNEYYYEKKKDDDYDKKKRKSDMMEKRLREIEKRKKLPDVRGELCDEKYFLRMNYKALI